MYLPNVAFNLKSFSGTYFNALGKSSNLFVGGGGPVLLDPVVKFFKCSSNAPDVLPQLIGVIGFLSSVNLTYLSNSSDNYLA